MNDTRGAMPALGDDSALGRAPGVAEYDLDTDLVLYSSAGGGGVVLNATAAHVWALCDGTRTIEQVARCIARDYAIDEQRALADVRAVATALAAAGLLTARRSPAGGQDDVVARKARRFLDLTGRDAG